MQRMAPPGMVQQGPPIAAPPSYGVVLLHPPPAAGSQLTSLQRRQWSPTPTLQPFPTTCTTLVAAAAAASTAAGIWTMTRQRWARLLISTGGTLLQLCCPWSAGMSQPLLQMAQRRDQRWGQKPSSLNGFRGQYAGAVSARQLWNLHPPRLHPNPMLRTAVDLQLGNPMDSSQPPWASLRRPLCLG